VFLLPDDLVSTGDPIDFQEWSAAVAPVIGNNNDSSLTGVSAVAELALRVSFSFDR
jgi:hypothetical protein